MEKEEALRDIHEIKQVMEESQRRTRHGKYWIGLALALVAIVIISGLILPLTLRSIKTLLFYSFIDNYYNLLLLKTRVSDIRDSVINILFIMLIFNVSK